MLRFTIVNAETENLFGVKAIKLECYSVENIKDPNTFLLLFHHLSLACWRDWAKVYSFWGNGIKVFVRFM
jgi:hypothetical protein